MTELSKELQETLLRTLLAEPPNEIACNLGFRVLAAPAAEELEEALIACLVLAALAEHLEA